MARLVREHDWASTEFGPVGAWPESLRAVIELILSSPHVATLAWGPRRLLIYNDAAAKLYGSRHPGALGRPLAETFADGYPSVAPLYERAFAGETVEVEAQPLSIEGEEIFDATLSPVRDKQGRVTAVHMIGFEIGLRVATERALRQSEERYRAFVTASSDVVYRMSPDWSEMRELDGRGVLADTAQPTTGWMQHYIDPNDWISVQAAIDHAIATRTMFELEHRVVRVDRSLGWIFSRAVPILDEQGEIVEWLGTASDVTERKRSEGALRESEALRRVALEGGRMGAWRWDLDAALIWGDAQFWTLWGYPPSDDPRPLTDFNRRMSPESVAEVGAVVVRAIEAGEQFDGPLEIVNGPNAGHWLRWQGRSEDDNPKLLYGVSFDITEQKLAEAAVRESEERQAFLLDLTDALRPLTDSGEIERQATRLLGEHLKADRCFLSPVYDDGSGMCVREEYLRSGASSVLGDYTFAQFGDFVGPTLHAGRILAVEDVDALTGLSAAERESYATVGIGAYLLIPVTRDGRLAAFLTINHQTPRTWSDADKAVARQTADRLWTARERGPAEEALRESEARLAAAFESVPAGLAAIDADGESVLANTQYRKFLPNGVVPSRDPERGKRWKGWDEEGRPLAIEDFPAARALRGENVIPGQEMVYTDDSGREIWTNVATVPTFDDAGRVTGAVTVISDIDIAKRSVEALRESEERQAFLLKLSDALRPLQEAVEIQNTAMRYLAEYLGVARAGYYQVVDDQDSFSLKARWERETPSLPEELKMSDFGTDVRDGYRAGRTLVSCDIERNSPSATGKEMYRKIGARARIGVPLVKQGRLLTVVAVHSTPARNWTSAEIHLVEDVAERTWEAVERARAEAALRESDAHQRLLLAELQHRVRNTLAIVRSIARRTAENSTSVEEMVAHFQGRLDAFSRVQAALTRSALGQVSLTSLVEDELVAHAAREGAQVRIDGPDLMLEPKTAERMSLAIHELTTNAVKHGALSRDEGRIEIRWRKERLNGRDELALHWQESGVELDGEEPKRQGFGMELLRDSLPYDLGAETSVMLHPTGLQFDLRMPMPPPRSDSPDRSEGAGHR